MVYTLKIRDKHIIAFTIIFIGGLSLTLMSMIAFFTNENALIKFVMIIEILTGVLLTGVGFVGVIPKHIPKKEVKKCQKKGC